MIKYLSEHVIEGYRVSKLIKFFTTPVDVVTVDLKFTLHHLLVNSRRDIDIA